MDLASDEVVLTSIRTRSQDSAATLYENESSSSSLEDLEALKLGPKPSANVTIKITEISAREEDNASIHRMSTNILEIIFDYALNKFDDCRDRLEAGRPKFISVLNKFVAAGTRVDMCLPAFPFKSANKVYKAFGFLPDKAEEIALARLHNMCRRIEEIYRPGAKVIIISDGLVYNDLLSISDRDTWFYGQALRDMATEMGFSNIGFSRLRDFVDFKLPETLDEIHYVANATNFRRFILNKFGKDDLDVDDLIATDEDTRLTYQGYRRFLMSDLRHIFTLGGKRTSNEYKRETKYLAKTMLVRGYAFAGAIKHNFPNHLRLSIHQSTGEHKVSMSLLDTKTGFTTPWHCSIALMADGNWMSAPMGDFKENPRMKVIYEKGRPSYFRELTEDEFLEEQRLAEQAAQLVEKTEVKELKEERNENFYKWEGVSCEVNSGARTRKLLDDVSGWLRGGTLTALMGVSGSGKTTLLNVLANRAISGVVGGEISVNGRTRAAVPANVAGLVSQQDLQFAGATVKEALIFSALLRQPKTATYVEKIANVEEIIDLLELNTFADVVVGTSGENLNSEQRKRLAIGIELVAKPSTALLLDQPLSGLDSQAALSICGLLRKIAQSGLAVLCVVDQPSMRILQTFDRLILLGSGGKQLYFGKVGVACKTIVSYFERCGARKYGADENPAEWMMEVTQTAPPSNALAPWSDIWKQSPEHDVIRRKIASIKDKYADQHELVVDSSVAESLHLRVAKSDALALQHAFQKYLHLDKMQKASDSQLLDGCRCSTLHHGSSHASIQFN